jgi:hypothetical protein
MRLLGAVGQVEHHHESKQNRGNALDYKQPWVNVKRALPGPGQPPRGLAAIGPLAWQQLRQAANRSNPKLRQAFHSGLLPAGHRAGCRSRYIADRDRRRATDCVGNTTAAVARRDGTPRVAPAPVSGSAEVVRTVDHPGSSSHRNRNYDPTPGAVVNRTSQQSVGSPPGAYDRKQTAQASSLSRAFASLRSGVAKPSVNQP